MLSLVVANRPNLFFFTARTGYTPSHAPSGFSYAPAVSPPPPQYVGGYDNIPSVSPQGMSPSSTYYSPSTVLSYQSRSKSLLSPFLSIKFSFEFN